MNGTFNPTYSSNIIWRDEDDTRCITDDLDNIEADITALETGKADTNHTHTGYATADHTHTGYATTDHTHTGYAAADHTHTGYAAAADVTALQNLVGDTAVSTQISTAIAGKVDAVEGKGLSTNDYTNEEKAKLAGIETEANKTIVDSELSSTSTNPVQNKVLNSELELKAPKDNPTFTGDILVNRSSNSYKVYDQGNVGVTLWSGNFSSGSIIVPGLSNYTFFRIKPASGATSMFALRNGSVIRGGGLCSSGNNLWVYGLSFTRSGDTLTYVDYGEATFNTSGFNTYENGLAISRIDGLF